MDDQGFLHLLIQRKLDDGRLPHNSIPRIWGGPGDGEACSACEEPIPKKDERRRMPSVARGRCPKCGAVVAVPYRGVDLDKCSRCHGVWLDFGELDQVVTEDTSLFGSLRRIFS